MPTSCYTETGGNPIHYLSYGHGQALLVCFHGYGLTGQSFQYLAPHLAERYTMVCPDLPHHGESKWDERHFTREMLKELVEEFMRIQKVDTVSLCGFSLGGRICLTLLELMPEGIREVLLLAPDGLVYNRPYHFATRNRLGRYLFRQMLKNPTPFILLLRLLHTVRLVNVIQYKFYVQHIESREARTLLYAIWNCLDELVPELQLLKNKVTPKNVPIHLVLGKFDKIIPLSHALTFQKGLPSVTVEVLFKGHRLLDVSTAGRIAALLL